MTSQEERLKENIGYHLSGIFGNIDDIVYTSFLINHYLLSK